MKRDCKHKPSCYEQPAKSEKVSQAEFQKLRETALRLAEKSPKKAAIILTAWLNQPARSKEKKAA